MVSERGSRDNTEKVTSDKEKLGRKEETRVRVNRWWKKWQKQRVTFSILSKHKRHHFRNRQIKIYSSRELPQRLHRCRGTLIEDHLFLRIMTLMSRLQSECPQYTRVCVCVCVCVLFFRMSLSDSSIFPLFH